MVSTELFWVDFYNFKIFDPYFQDDYYIFKNLTLNLGVRVSFFGTFWERNHLISNWSPSAYSLANAPQIDIDGSATGQEGALIPNEGNPFDGMITCGLNGVPRGCLKNHLVNPAPRLGFSWDPLGDGKMAIRGGYGIFFEHTNGMEGNAENLEGTPPIVETPTQYNVNGYANVGGQGLLFPLSTTSIPDRTLWPYVQQWHLDVQRDLIHDTVATLAYVGSKGTHLTLQHELNQLEPTPPALNPYKPGQYITNVDCSWGPGSSQPNVITDNYGVPTNAYTSYGVPVPYFPSATGGIPSGPAVNLFVACGNDPDLVRTNYPGRYESGGWHRGRQRECTLQTTRPHWLRLRLSRYFAAYRSNAPHGCKGSRYQYYWNRRWINRPRRSS